MPARARSRLSSRDREVFGIRFFKSILVIKVRGRNREVKCIRACTLYNSGIHRAASACLRVDRFRGVVIIHRIFLNYFCLILLVKSWSKYS